MDKGNLGAGAPRPLELSRVFPAPRELVFKAWSTAEHLKRWFSPSILTVPDATIDFRAGGVFDLCMRMPDGQDSWMRGHFTEVTPPERLAFDTVVEIAGAPRFAVKTIVTFASEGAGSRMSVHQSYVIHDANFSGAVAGAAEGWRSTLDKLEKEVERLKAGDKAAVVHGSFSVERTYDAPPAAVYRALTDKDAKARWFAGGDDWTLLEREMDVRDGGRERVRGRWASGVTTTFDAIYHDVVPDKRLVYTYVMHLDDAKISASLATMEISAAGKGARLLVTEQGAFLDGYDDAGKREHGTGMLLDMLGDFLKQPG